MNVLERHERANRAITALDTRLAEIVAATEDGAVHRAATVRSLPDVDYGTRAGCDRALVEIGRRIEQIGAIEDVPAVDDERTRALIACRELAASVRERRSDLALIESADDD